MYDPNSDRKGVGPGNPVLRSIGAVLAILALAFYVALAFELSWLSD